MKNTSELLFLRPDLLIKHNKHMGFLIIAVIYYIWLAFENFIMFIFLALLSPNSDRWFWVVLWLIIYTLSFAIACKIVHTIITRPYDGLAALRVTSAFYVILDLIYVFTQHFAGEGIITPTYITPLFHTVFAVYFWVSPKVKYRQICGAGYGDVLKKDFGKSTFYSPKYDDMLYYFSLEMYAAKAYADCCNKDTFSIPLYSDIYTCLYFVLKRTKKLKKDSPVKAIRALAILTNQNSLSTSIDNKSFRELLKVYNETRHDPDLLVSALVHHVAEKHQTSNGSVIDTKNFTILLSMYEYDLIIGNLCEYLYYIICSLSSSGAYDTFDIPLLFGVYYKSLSELRAPVLDELDNPYLNDIELQEVLEDFEREQEQEVLKGTGKQETKTNISATAINTPSKEPQHFENYTTFKLNDDSDVWVVDPKVMKTRQFKKDVKLYNETYDYLKKRNEDMERFYNETNPSQPKTETPKPPKQMFSDIYLDEDELKEALEELEYENQQTKEKTAVQNSSAKKLFCTKCGVNLPSDAAFCHKCGTRVYKG